jgi:hypothetical protein
MTTAARVSAYHRQNRQEEFRPTPAQARRLRKAARRSGTTGAGS